MNSMGQKGKKIVTLAAMVLVCVSSVPAIAANKLIVKGTDGTTDKFVVSDEGNIGVGTTSPIGAIHANGQSYTTTQFISQWNGTSNNGGGGFLGFHNNNSGALPSAGDRLGYFLFGSYINSTRVIGAGMTVKAEGNWSETSAPTYLTFETAPVGATSRGERLRITSSGNVGLGQSNPKQKLDINGGLRLYTVAARPTCNENSRGTFWFTRGGTGVADTLDVCAKESNESYVWKNLF